jgi:hypothetical protein
MDRPGGLGLRHHVEADDQAFELGLRRRVAAHDQRIMAGDDVLRARRTKARERVASPFRQTRVRYDNVALLAQGAQ